MKISIVTPSYNGSHHLPHLLESLSGQYDRDFEYVVQDGGSKDGSVDLFKAWEGGRALLKVEPDKGMYDALRKGFERASGDVVGWINSDDVLYPWTISIVREVFTENPDIDWITGIPTAIDDVGVQRSVALIAPYYSRTGIRMGAYGPKGLGCVQQESMFFRKSLYDKAGGIRADLRYAADFHLWKDMARFAEPVQVGVTMAGFRMHGKNLSNNVQKYNAECGGLTIPFGKIVHYLNSGFRAFCSLRTRYKLPRAKLPKRPA